MGPMNSESINIQRLNLYSQLFLYGDFIPLKIKLDAANIHKDLSSFEPNWVPYNIQRGDTGRMGLSVTSLDGGLSGYPDLQSLYQYTKETGHRVSENDFDKPTGVVEQVSELHQIFRTFEGGVGRSRFVRFRQGGFFPPHRDQSASYQVPDYFRIFVALHGCGSNSLHFTYDNKLIQYEVGRLYLFNALKVHSVFSFVDGATTLALSLKLNQDNIRAALNQLEVN